MATVNFKTFEEMLELMETKVVKTEQGPYIRVQDLQEMNEELGKARQAQAEKDALPKPTNFAGANAAARDDREFTKLFEKPTPVAPAVVRDNNVAQEEPSDAPVSA